MLRNVKVMSWRRGKLLKEYAEHGSSERLTFVELLLDMYQKVLLLVWPWLWMQGSRLKQSCCRLLVDTAIKRIMVA